MSRVPTRVTVTAEEHKERLSKAKASSLPLRSFRLEPRPVVAAIVGLQIKLLTLVSSCAQALLEASRAAAAGASKVAAEARGAEKQGVVKSMEVGDVRTSNVAQREANQKARRLACPPFALP